MTNTPIHPAQQPIEQLLSDCATNRQKRSGPGGQHRNKVETAIRIEHLPTGIKAQASETRNQEKNRKKAIFRLRILLALGVRTPIDPASYQPSSIITNRIKKGRLALNPNHEQYPAILAEILDLTTTLDGDVKTAAELLNLTTTQLIKLLKTEPRALELINRQRRQNNRHPLS